MWKLGNFRQQKERKRKEASSKTDERGADLGESSGIDKKSRHEDEKIRQLTEPEKYEKMVQEGLEKGDERATSKACIRLQYASKITGQTPKTCIAFGHVYRKDGEKEAAIYHYEKALEIAQGDQFYEAEALRGLGHTYREVGENEKAIDYYQQALLMAQAGGNKEQMAEVFLGLGHAYENNEQNKIAIEKYKMARKIAKDHDSKWEETEACRGLGKVYRNLGDNEAAQRYLLEAADIAAEQGFKKSKSTIYLGLAHTYRSKGEYENAIESYEKAMKFAQENDNVWEEMSAYLGVGDSLMKIGRIKEGKEYFVKAEKTAEKEWDILPQVLHTMNNPEQRDIDTLDRTPEKEKNEKEEKTYRQNIFSLNEPGEAGDKRRISITEGFREDAISMSIQGPEEANDKTRTSTTEGICEGAVSMLIRGDVNTNTDEVSVEKLPPCKDFVKKIPAVYTYQASIEEGLTEEVRIKMAENVKRSAHVNLLNQSDPKFSGDDRPIYNMAKNCVCKNDPTDRPGRISTLLGRLNRSVGRITCGGAQGTCFLVAENIVITCYHVYLDFIKERRKTNQPTMPIKVAFDCYEPRELENAAVVVEVDEFYEPLYSYYSSEFDYILLCLNQSRHLEGRVRLGELVRGYYVYEGLVCITGFPQNRELREETCVVVEIDKEERLRRRQCQLNGGMHMAKINGFFKEYPQRLAYDTSLYRGSSGSPGFDMNGNIVVLHAQGYDLDVQGKKYSLMEFGVNFGAICADLERRFHTASRFFPNWNLQDDVEMTEADARPINDSVL